MNLAERMAANDDYGNDEDSVHTLLKKHEVCDNPAPLPPPILQRGTQASPTCGSPETSIFLPCFKNFSYWKKKSSLTRHPSSLFMIKLMERLETRIKHRLKLLTDVQRELLFKEIFSLKKNVLSVFL